VRELENQSCCNNSNSDKKVKVIKIRPKSKNYSKPDFSEATKEATKESSCCCGGNVCSSEIITEYNKNDYWITDEIKTDAGIVPQVSTKLFFNDTLGAWKVRWGIDRMNYKVNPGIYAVGTPDKESHVLVTANYKLTFDALRKELTGLNAWILVLDTKGINVWCAAGKGTFGTKELINRINKTKLWTIVSHRTLILPQLGAPGVSAHEVTQVTSFIIKYGPVRANDIKQFINSGMKATDEMRSVKFNLKDRLILTPMELVGTFKTSLMILGVLFLLNLFTAKPFGIIDIYAYAGALIAGCVITPVLLPWIPGRAFSWKGWLMGFLWTLVVISLNGGVISPSFGILKELGYLLVLPSISAFYAMNFTGSSTYTSFSGVLKEMRKAVPPTIVTIGIGAVLLLVSSFIKL
jgi:hypothetical protein